ncbi:hypothetical protein GCM10010840_28090 [Deinococcus aerolatus]|uniref:Uncharacterized protein n=1 Tax=Deinococcus aerolatus TaxID=522487 RepID=A0ABQ2GDG7_9DEIO|nr:hypothetical protein GCM10010840_28090 [Deinococcus aerolatus]
MSEGDVVEAARFSGRELHITHLTEPLAIRGCQDQGLTAPVAQGMGDQWTVNAATVDGWILQLPMKSTFAALDERGTGADGREPGGDETAL